MATKKNTSQKFRNRVKEMKLMRAGDLLDHEDNWHLHPQFQNDALEGVLEQHGIVDVLLAYWSDKRDGYVLVNGHGRKALDQDAEWPVIILDINDEEASDVLALLDTIGNWGQTDALKLHELISRAASVKAVLPVEDLMTVEVALKRTGLKRRGAALHEICQYYIDNHKGEA